MRSRRLSEPYASGTVSRVRAALDIYDKYRPCYEEALFKRDEQILVWSAAESRTAMPLLYASMNGDRTNNKLGGL